MAVYKVPQDVEAEDKLLGPFSFRQFIYLIIVAAAGAIAWFLASIFIPLAVLPLPVIIFFGALALPLRKDQPMETYLAAIVSFYLKPRKRMWQPDGQQALIEIIAPKVTLDPHRTKDFDETEAARRLSYLASIVDTRGWAVRGVEAQPDSSLNPNVYYEAQNTQDVLDDSTTTAHNIDAQLDQANQRQRQELLQRIQRPTSSPTAAAQTPGTEATQNTESNSSETPSKHLPSADIMDLANNPEFSVETIAHQANRIREKEGLPEDEVSVSLR